ncbi:MAG TPA: energy transducer TonB [Casimicrobiaceae bacterium]|nr:energy transducer TonB [Casimicrobiaceae bacterium]
MAAALPPARIPAAALAPFPHLRVAAAALAASIAIHAALLALHFSLPAFKLQHDRAPPLEIALVNAKTRLAPAKADILAQANLDGGGNTDEERRAKSPLPPSPDEPPARRIAVRETPPPRVDRPAKERLTQPTSTVTLPLPSPQSVDDAEATPSPTANELMHQTLDAFRLEAQIARDQDAYQKMPRKKHIGARATEYRYARYVEDWRMKVERIGNLNYPEAARERKLYGSLVLTVGIRADGSLDSVVVNHPSPSRILDAAAKHIVEMSAPFAPFPADIRKDTDILYVTRTWTFAPGDQMSSSSGEP